MMKETSVKRRVVCTGALAACLLALLVLVTAAGASSAPASRSATVPAETVFVGERVTLHSDIAADDDSTIVRAFEVRKQSGELCETDGGTFVPAESGLYKVTVCKERDGQSVVSYYYLNAVYSDKPVIVTAPSFPNALINGCEYELPALTATLYAADGTSAPADVRVTAVYDGVAAELDETRRYTPAVKRSGDTVLFRYTVGAGEAARTEQYSVPVVILRRDDGTLALQNAFATRSVDSAAADRAYCTYRFGTEGARLSYCNLMPAAEFQLRWKMQEALCNFDEMVVCLTDSVDETQSVELVLSENPADGKTRLRINDTTAYSMEAIFKSASFTLKYGASKHNVSDENGVVGIIANTVDKLPFDGFSSGIIRVAVEFRGVRSYSSVAFSQIGNQRLNNATKDTINPYFFFPQEIRSRYELNDQVTINRAQAYDMLDPAAAIQVTVYELDEYGNAVSVATDDNGTRIEKVDCDTDYYFTARKVGEYKVEYTAVDWFGRTETYFRIYKIADNEPPVVTFGPMAKEATVNRPVALPELTMSDNGGVENLTVQISYYTPNNVVEVLAAGSTQITFTVPGRYKIVYLIYDTDYNFVTQEFTVQVR